MDLRKIRSAAGVSHIYETSRRLSLFARSLCLSPQARKNPRSARRLRRGALRPPLSPRLWGRLPSGEGRSALCSAPRRTLPAVGLLPPGRPFGPGETRGFHGPLSSSAPPPGQAVRAPPGRFFPSPAAHRGQLHIMQADIRIRSGRHTARCTTTRGKYMKNCFNCR